MTTSITSIRPHYCQCIILLGILLCSSGCAIPFRGRTVVSPRFKTEGARISIMYEATDAVASEQWFVAKLHESLMVNGYKVLERLDYAEVLGDLMSERVDQESHSTTGGVASAFATHNVYGFTPKQIKRIGKLYGLDYIGVFTFWNGKRACLRLIDCETAEVVATTFSSMPVSVQNEDVTSELASCFILSLRYGLEAKDAKGNPTPVYMGVSLEEKREGAMSGVKQVLYQKKHRIGDRVKYISIFTMRD